MANEDRPSLLGTIGRILFMVPFVGIGLVVIAGGLVQSKISPFPIAFGGLFAGVGAWQIVVALRRHRRTRVQDRTVVSPQLAGHVEAVLAYRSAATPEKPTAAQLYAPVIPSAPLPIVRTTPGKSLPIALGRSGPRDAWFGTIFSIVWLGLTGVFFVGFVASKVWLAAAFVSIFVLVGIAVFVISVRKLLGQLKLPRVEVSEEPVFLGDMLRVNVTQAGRARIARLQVDLVVREIARYTVGTDTRTETHEIWTTSLLDEASHDVASGELWANEATVTLPKELPPSFAATNNFIAWLVRVRADITGWPDYDETYELRVLPKPMP